MFDQNVTSPFTTTVTTPSQTQAQKPLRDSVKQAVNKYLKQLDNTNIDNLYEMVLAEVEAPLLEEVMTFTRGNQTRAAIMMGINRGTLRKKFHALLLRLFALLLRPDHAADGAVAYVHDHPADGGAVRIQVRKRSF